jgi:hypothetical protein
MPSEHKARSASFAVNNRDPDALLGKKLPGGGEMEGFVNQQGGMT